MKKTLQYQVLDFVISRWIARSSPSFQPFASSSPSLPLTCLYTRYSTSTYVSLSDRRSIVLYCDRLIRIWDTKTRRCLAQFAGHRSIVPKAVIGSTDEFIVSCSFDGTVKVWNAHTAECERTLSGHEDSVMDVALSPCTQTVTLVVPARER